MISFLTKKIKGYLLFSFYLFLLTTSAFAESLQTDKVLNVIFTIDVEDMIEGDLSEYGIEQNCGINYIMDTFEKFGFRAVYFVNIYEHNHYDPGYMPSLLQRIHERGNEVGLHAHPPIDNSIPVFVKGMTFLDINEQIEVLEYGKDYIFNSIGQTPISFRSGAYSINDETFKALFQTGFLVDSSLYFGHKNNHLEQYSGLHNQVMTINGITEIPIFIVFDGAKWVKLDINSMQEKEIIDVLEKIKSDENFNSIQIMFHSYSFLDMDGNKKDTPIIHHGNKLIYGENIDKKREFENILNYLKNSEGYNVTTFADYLKMELPIPEYREDNIIYLANKELAIFHTDIKAEIKDGKLFLCNEKKGDVSYAWVVRNSNDNDDKFYSGYDKQFREYAMSFPADVNGTYLITGYIMDSEKNKVSSGNVFSVTVENGIPVIISEIW